MKLTELDINDMFRFSWEEDEFIGIVTKVTEDSITFDDVISLGSGTTSTATSIYAKDPEPEFEYFEFICAFKPRTPQSALQELKPEYFL